MTRSDFIAHIEHTGFSLNGENRTKRMQDGTVYLYRLGKLKVWHYVKFPEGWRLIEHAYYKNIKPPKMAGYRFRGFTDGHCAVKAFK